MLFLAPYLVSAGAIVIIAILVAQFRQSSHHEPLFLLVMAADSGWTTVNRHNKLRHPLARIITMLE